MKRLMTFLCLVLLCSAVVAQPHFKVDVKGSGKPMILIPGLASPGSVWDGVAEKLKDGHELHILTLPGFAGMPAMEGDFLPVIRDEIIAYVKDKKLEKPVLMGHSLGGTLALWTASKAPELFGPLVIVDGLPAQGKRNPTTPEDRKKIADATKRRYASMTQGDYALSAEDLISMLITSRETVKALALYTGKSQPKVIGQAMYELLLTDLSKDLANITSPILVFVSGGLAFTDVAFTEVQETYKKQYAEAKNVKFVPMKKARHFIFLDDPEGFLKATQDFLK